MKKRLISVLLTLCLAAALFSSMSVTAFAADTIKYTLKSGDTVYGVCQSLGIDFYANYTWITKTNNIKNYANLKPGTVITLPAAGAKSDSATGTTPVEGSANDKTLLDGDFISGYLVPHVMKSGETVYGVCSEMGIDFHSNSDRIMKLNNISSYNKIAAGRTVLFPSTKAPESGSCVKIVAHKIVSGDTTYGICSSYGISYDGNLKLLQTLNNKENMGAIKAGQLLYLPVPAVISANQGGGANSGNTNTGTTAPAPAQYEIYTSISNGELLVQISGVTVTKAKAGDTIKVECTADKGYTLDKISVTKHGDAAASVEVAEDGSFKMPAYAVDVKVSFKAAA